MSKILLLKISVLFDSISKNMYLSIQYKDINHITVFALELQHKLLAHPRVVVRATSINMDKSQ